MAQESPPIVLFTYPESVVGRRTEWYLTLRGISYNLCEVDNKMPRSVLDRLDVHYRRIPVLAVGRDIYCDSRCIIDHLEKLYTSRPKLGSEHPYERGIEKILETWAFDGGLFARTAQMITPDAGLVQHRSWLDDRAELTGVRFSAEGLKGGVKDALSHARLHLRMVEEELLADGRQWLSGGQQPGLSDVHVLWIFDWMMRPKEAMGMAHAYPWLLNEQNYPRTMAWVKRMADVFNTAQAKHPPRRISDIEAVKLIESSAFWQADELPVESLDPTGLVRGEEVDLIALDSASAAGINRRDVGRLEGLTVTSATIGTETKNGVHVRIHYQRTNVRVVQAGGKPRLTASEIPKL
ncbi:hypothetical protein BDY17DRAFT_128733 [Neohortaea acidophila]|uniref:GST N-terminal domain-containing protein n=1 Tax=Neohortaea acidophila TaxID=245834 RepID=A0A6A6PZ41_9PEZI|nr:uncharacterized protein BDY17DRAFT_128733 [Neohortaea acidophila]KAF2484457.1 hypothetical protein BDY17DRAFT_128733 [Neohortaea acidophila]